MDYKNILDKTIQSFPDGDRWVTDRKKVRFIREDIVLKAMENTRLTEDLLQAQRDYIESLGDPEDSQSIDRDDLIISDGSKQ